MNTHVFTLLVKTNGDREQAELAVLAAFGKRWPDSCEFYLTDQDSLASTVPALLKALKEMSNSYLIDYALASYERRKAALDQARAAIANTESKL